MKNIVGLDIETYDPFLKEKGASWVYGEGEVLCTAVYFYDSKVKVVHHGDGGSKVRSILTDPDCIVIGAHIIYDLGWLCYSLHLPVSEIKCTVICVLTAEAAIDEYAPISLDYCAMKYLGVHKTTSRIEEWIKSIPEYSGGDFRRYLRYAAERRWDLLEEYVKDDAALPCLIWEKQCHIFEQEQDRFYYESTELLSRYAGKDVYGEAIYKKFPIHHCSDSSLTRSYRGRVYRNVSNFDNSSSIKISWVNDGSINTDKMKYQEVTKGTIYPVFIDFSLITIMLENKTHGVKISMAAKKRNCDILTDVYNSVKADFDKRNASFNTKSSLQKAQWFINNNWEFQDRVKVKEIKGIKVTKDNISEGLTVLAEIMPKFFHIEKGEICGYVEHSSKNVIINLLESNNIVYTCNPRMDKVALQAAGAVEGQEDCLLVNNMNKAKDINSKILGEEYNRFISRNERIYADFNITKGEEYGAKTGRLSASLPNLMQIPAHGELVLGVGEEKSKLDLSKLCREIFIPDDEYWAHFDYPQIEYRIFLHFAIGKGAEELRKKFHDDPKTDFHSKVAEITGLLRSLAKHITFGILYGMSLNKLMAELGCSKEKAKEVIDNYLEAVPCLMPTIEAVSASFIEKGYVITIGGRHFHLRTERESYKGINGLDQGSSADMTKKAIVLANDRGIWDILKFYFPVHDELDFSVPPTLQGVKACKEVAYIMANAYKLRVPVFIDPEIGHNWYEASDDDAEKRFNELEKEVEDAGK